jgi:hypothetical protein
MTASFEAEPFREIGLLTCRQAKSVAVWVPMTSRADCQTKRPRRRYARGRVTQPIRVAFTTAQIWRPHHANFEASDSRSVLDSHRYWVNLNKAGTGDTTAS